MQHVVLNTVRSHALFVSALQPSDDPDAEQVRQAITGAVRQFGSRGCAGRMAQEFGDHPETAVARMRWARQIVAKTFEAAPARVSHIRHGRLSANCSSQSPPPPDVALPQRCCQPSPGWAAS
jgi:hypothetical protein